jgi:hypothetical protein
MTPSRHKFQDFRVLLAREMMRVRFITRSLGVLVRRKTNGEMRGANVQLALRQISAVRSTRRAAWITRALRIMLNYPLNFDADFGGTQHRTTGSWNFCSSFPPF